MHALLATAANIKQGREGARSTPDTQPIVRSLMRLKAKHQRQHGLSNRHFARLHTHALLLKPQESFAHEDSEFLLMIVYRVEFWRGDTRVRDFAGEEHWTIDDAAQNVRDLLQSIMEDPSMEDWTGCRFEIARSDGRSIV